MADCIFCEIIQGTAPASVVYEDAACKAFMDVHPIHQGHLLIVPRIHYDELSKCPVSMAGRLFEVAARLGPVVTDVVGGTGFNIWTANGKDAGQEVFHLHLHVLPRFADDSFGLRFPQDYPQEASREELEKVAGWIKTLLWDQKRSRPSSPS